MILIISIISILGIPSTVLAIIPGGQECTNNPDPCESDYGCLPLQANPGKKFCQYIPGRDCTSGGAQVCATQNKNYDCLPLQSNTNKKVCQLSQPGQQSNFSSIFGKITPPDALKGLVKDPTGAKGLSAFLSNLIALFFSIAAIVLVFMLIWGGFDWLTSEGDKEKVASARNKIMNALIGLLLFAVAFAIFQVLGTFTGFKFFVGQK